MKLVGLIYQEEELDILKDKLDAVMIEVDYLSNPMFKKYDSKKIIEKTLSYNLIPILKFNKMIHPNEITIVKNMINDYLNYNCLYYITDLGLLNIFKELNLINKVIYDPITMICNSLDAKNYYDFGVCSVGISNEITIEDLNLIINKTNVKAFYQVFGYRLMLHSKRMLVSLYEEKINKKFNKDNMVLVESTRSDIYPIVENDQGTLIYRSGIISLIKELKNMNLEFAYIDHFRIDDKTYIEVVNIYSNYLNDKIELTLAKEQLELLNLNYSDGFSYKDSVYQKEEF